MKLSALLFGTAPVKPSLLSQAFVGVFVAGVLSMTARTDAPMWLVALFGWLAAGLYRIIFIEALNR